MALIQSDIDQYIHLIRQSLSTNGYTLSKYQKLGRNNIECYKLKFRLLNHFVRIIIEYFNRGISYSTKNFFTIAEARDIMQHINNLADTNYILDLD